MKLSKEMYEILKRIAMVWLPAAATLYGTVSAVWGLPAASAVIGTIVAVDTFLGILLGVSTSLYNAGATSSGVITVNHANPEMGRLSFNITQDLDELEQLGTVVFKVVHSVAQTATPAPAPVGPAAPAPGGPGGGTTAPGHPIV